MICEMQFHDTSDAESRIIDIEGSVGVVAAELVTCVDHHSARETSDDFPFGMLVCCIETA